MRYVLMTISIYCFLRCKPAWVLVFVLNMYFVGLFMCNFMSIRCDGISASMVMNGCNVSSCLQVTIIIHPGISGLGQNWIRLSPNVTHLGPFNISFSTFWLGEPKCTEIWGPGFVPFGGHPYSELYSILSRRTRQNKGVT